MYKFLLTAFILVTALCTGCKKNSSSLGNDNNNPESAKYILITTSDNSNPETLCINPDKTIRWRRTGIATANDIGMHYSDGMIYTSGFMNDPYSGEIKNTLYAIDANTGKDVWVIKNAPDIFYNLHIYDGTLYAYLGTAAGAYITAFDAKTGNEQWRMPVAAKWIGSFTAEGNMLYFTQETGNEDSLAALSIINKTIQWKAKAYIYDDTYGGLITKDNYIIMPARDGSVCAVQKTTGKTMWQAADLRRGRVFDAGNNVYFFNDQGKLCSVNISNGQISWRAQVVNNVNKNLYAAGQHLYVTSTSVDAGTVYSFNLDGSIAWQKDFTYPLMYPVVVGNSLYVYKKTGETIVILDVATGNIKDTISITKWATGLCLIVGMDDKVFAPSL